jgi:maltose alpha-D-glucosyltransferase/alpha-amylase
MDFSADIFSPQARDRLARLLLDYARVRRWFRAKARGVRGAEVTDLFWLDGGAPDGPAIAVAILAISYEGGDPDRDLYLIPLCIGDSAMTAALRAEMSHAVVAPLESVAGCTLLVDALATGQAGKGLLALMRDGRPLRGEASDLHLSGELRAEATPLFAEVAGAAPLTVVVSRSEQTNSTLLFGERLLLKIYRQLGAGENPELEMGRFLSTHCRPPCVPRVLAGIEYKRGDGVTHSMGIAHEYLHNDGDAWALALRQVENYFDVVSGAEAFAKDDSGLEALIARAMGPGAAETGTAGDFVRSAEVLGRRTGELHLALAGESRDPAFVPEPLSAADRGALVGRARSMLDENLVALRAMREKLSAESGALADHILDPSTLRAIATHFSRFQEGTGTVLKTRTHGDLHLGQVLVCADDFVIIDFEGEPARPLAERRSKSSPLRDVMSMLRSFDYAPEAVLRAPSKRAPRREPWARLWTRNVSAAYLRAYLGTVGEAPFIPRSREELVTFLTFYQLEKVIYEIGYEVNNRPDWVAIPLRGLAGLLHGSAANE